MHEASLIAQIDKRSLESAIIDFKRQSIHRVKQTHKYAILSPYGLATVSLWKHSSREMGSLLM